MKILQLGKFYPIEGGVERLMYELTTGLSKKGVLCDMMCTTKNGKSDVIKLNENAKILRCRTVFQISATTFSFRMLLKLRKICNRYDIIHIHHPDPMATLALLYSRYKNRVVLHWHSDILKQRYLLKLYAPLQAWLIKRADMIIGTSPIYIRESPFLRNVQYKTDYFAIGINKFFPGPYKNKVLRQLAEVKKIVFSMGRLVGYKGFKYLIEAASFLNDNYLILIAGNGPLEKQLKKQIRDNHLSEKVKMIGYIPDSELYEYFNCCHVFCLPSIQKTEALGIVQIEAMSCGKPVVATEIPGSGTSWVNAHGVSGLNVSPCDSKGLADAIMNICSIPARYSEYCQQAKARYRQYFTKKEMIENCMSKYLQLTQKN